MGRRLRLGPAFRFSLSTHRVAPTTPRGRRIAAVLVALEAADHLPGPQDTAHSYGHGPPAWVRRVPGENLWVHYRFDEDEVRLLAVDTQPP